MSCAISDIDSPLLYFKITLDLLHESKLSAESEVRSQKLKSSTEKYIYARGLLFTFALASFNS